MKIAWGDAFAAWNESGSLLASLLHQDQQSVDTHRKDGGQKAAPEDLGGVHRAQAVKEDRPQASRVDGRRDGGLPAQTRDRDQQSQQRQTRHRVGHGKLGQRLQGTEGGRITDKGFNLFSITSILMLLAEVVLAVAMNHALQRLFEENGYQYKRGQKMTGRP